ncbi:MAG TPA: YdbL family protein [Desulfobacteraceae bacterium]|nr:YdbL family protein [Desulfobacteraceae bacterium]
MTKNRLIVPCLVFFLFSLFGGQAALAADGIKERMKKRLPKIVQMKEQGILGENARGYLEFVTEKKPDKALVEKENRDRKTIYSAIAKQQGVSIEKVEKLRGLQIVKKAKQGEYLKNSNGNWYQK